MPRIAFALAALALLTTSPAQAQAACTADAGGFIDRLAEKYGEVLTAAGVDANGNLVQVYSSDDKGTWTIAVTVPGGPTCVVSSGEGWVREAPEAPKPEGRTS